MTKVIANPGSTLYWQMMMKQQMDRSMVSRTVKKFNPLAARKHGYCIACAKRGVKVKLDFTTRKERWIDNVYEVIVGTCPMCKKEDKRFHQVNGKGLSGRNAYLQGPRK